LIYNDILHAGIDACEGMKEGRKKKKGGKEGHVTMILIVDEDEGWTCLGDYWYQYYGKPRGIKGGRGKG